MKPISIYIPSLAIAANIILVGWILLNGIQDGFSGTLPEKATYLSLIFLLLLNSYLLMRKQKK
jgi:hypothetical protein